jgi:uncharacterized membrane protein YgcG
MKCPSCQRPLAAPQPQCPNCKMTLRRLDIRFGALPRHSRLFTDRTATLPTRAIRDLRELLRLFQRKFPQSLFSVFVINGAPGGSIAEYTFWLANRARFGSLNAIASENFDLLLGIDLGARAAALVIGYGLENYVSERDLERALAESASAFHAGDVARAVRNCVEYMTVRMREVSREAEEKLATQDHESIDHDSI